MTYTRRTLRRLKGSTRKIAEAVNDLERGLRAVKRILPDIERYELELMPKASEPPLNPVDVPDLFEEGEPS